MSNHLTNKAMEDDTNMYNTMNNVTDLKKNFFLQNMTNNFQIIMYKNIETHNSKWTIS